MASVRRSLPGTCPDVSSGYRSVWVEEDVEEGEGGRGGKEWRRKLRRGDGKGEMGDA